MRKINYILLSLFSFICFSCVDDALKTNFVEIDEISVEGIEKRYDITLGDVLTVNPIISSKFGAKEEDFDYIWYKYNLQIQNKADTLGFEKNLNVKITNVKPGIPHFLSFKIINKKNKLFKLVTVSLTASSFYSNGVVALVKTDNQVDLSYIKNGQSEVDNNLFGLSNGGKKLSSKSFHIMSLDPSLKNPGIHRRVLISTGDGDIGVYLSPETFEIVDYVKDLFFRPLPQNDDYKLITSFNSQSSEYLIINDKLYDRKLNIDSTKFNSAVLCRVEPQSHSLAAFAATTAGNYAHPIVFDNLNGRFMIHPDGTPSYSFIPNSVDKTLFDPRKLSGMTMICGGYFLDNSSSNAWTLMKDANTGNFRVLSLQCLNIKWVTTWKLLGNKEITRAMAPQLFEAKTVKSASYSYVAGSPPYVYEMRGLKNMFLYVVNNKLYVYNITSDYEGILIDGDVEGFTIDDVYVHRTYLTVKENGGKNYFERLALSIRDNNATDKKGGVAYYRVNVLGGISATQYFKKTGFCDQVLSLDEKIN